MIATGLRLRGFLSVDAVKASLDEVLTRHRGLQVQYSLEEACHPTTGRKITAGSQRIVERRHVELRLVKSPDEGQLLHNVFVRALIDEEIIRPPLALEAPLLQGTLIQFSQNDHLLVISVDHVAADREALSLICTEIEALLGYYTHGGAYPLMPVHAHSPDLALYEREQVGTEAVLPAAAHWRDVWAQFGGSRIGDKDLPFRREGHVSPESWQQSDEIIVCRQGFEDIQRCLTQFRMTPYMLFAGSLMLLLARYSTKQSIAIWSHFANRRSVEARRAVGCFVNSHIIGSDVLMSEYGRDFLKRMKRVVLDAIAHQGLALTALWQLLQCYPRHPDIRVLLDVRTDNRAEHQLWEGLTSEVVDLPRSPHERFSSLGVSVVRERNQYRIGAQYCAPMFPASAISRLVQDLGTVARLLATSPDVPLRDIAAAVPVSDLPRRTDDERDQYMGDFVVSNGQLLPRVHTTLL